MTEDANLPLTELASSTELLKGAWEIYKQRFLLYSGIAALPLVFIIIAIIGAFLFTSLVSPKEYFGLSILIGIFSMFVYAFLILLSQSSLLVAIWNSDNTNFKNALSGGLKLLASYIWVVSLGMCIITGGLVFFFVPGLILAMWCSLSIFVMVAENKSGLDAILKSREYIRGHFFDVIWRLVVLGVVCFLCALAVGVAEAVLKFLHLGGLTDCFSVILFLFFTPFFTIYLFLIYDNLREIKKDVAEYDSNVELIFKISGVIGLIAPIVSLIFSIPKFQHIFRLAMSQKF